MKYLLIALNVLYTLVVYSQARSVDVVITNTTNFTLQFRGISASHGIISIPPPQYIYPGGTITFRGESGGIMTGTKGKCQYRIIANTYTFYQGLIEINWNCPYFTPASYNFNAIAPNGIFVTWQGGLDENFSVNFTISQSGNLVLDPGYTLPHTLINNLTLKIKTSDNFQAGTDNDVYFKIGPYVWKLTDLNKNNLFEKNQEDVFVLPIKGELYSDDINYVSLEKKGPLSLSRSPFPNIDGDWEIDYLELVVNNDIIIHKDLNLILSDNTPTFIEAIQNNKVSLPHYYFLSSISYLLCPKVSAFGQFDANIVTRLKSRGFSGWIPANVTNIAVSGTVVQGPVLSSDGFITIDIEVYRIIIDGVSYKLDSHDKIRKKYLRIEYISQPPLIGVIAPYLDKICNDLINNKVIPKTGDFCEVLGTGKYDTDEGGWPEIHATNQDTGGRSISPFYILDKNLPLDLDASALKCLKLLNQLEEDSKTNNILNVNNIKTEINILSSLYDKFNLRPFTPDKINLFNNLDNLNQEFNEYIGNRKINLNKGIINPTQAELSHRMVILGIKDQFVSLFNTYSQVGNLF